MTLNITLASRWLMAQSSDFRLTHDGATKPDPETAQKQVVLQYPGWSGLLCYTGIATYHSHDTARWLTQVLIHKEGPRSPEQIAEHIAAEGNTWLKKIPLEHRKHTFTMITYEGRTARIRLISTYEKLGHQPLEVPASTFAISLSRVRKPICVVTGWSRAVTPKQKEQLTQLLATNPSAAELRTAIARASRTAAPRAKCNPRQISAVGEECVVSHLAPDGSGEATVYGNLKGKFIPTLIINGNNIAEAAPEALKGANAGPARLVGVTWNAFRQPGRLMVTAYRELSKQTGSGWPDDDTSATAP